MRSCLFSRTEKAKELSIRPGEISHPESTVSGHAQGRKVMVIHNAQQPTGIDIEEKNKADEIPRKFLPALPFSDNLPTKGGIDTQSRRPELGHQSCLTVEPVVMAHWLQRKIDPPAGGKNGGPLTRL